MNVLIIGATGGTGRHLVAHALAAGDHVTAFVRSPAKITTTHERLRVVQGDVLRPDTVRAAVAGQDAVLSALGPAAGSPPGRLISEGTGNIIAAMKTHGVRRLVLESGIMVGEAKGMSRINRLLLAIFRRINRKLYLDKVRTEQLVVHSGLDWTLVRPPKLREAPARGAYRAGEDLDVALLKGLAFVDVADFMVRAAHDDAHIRRTIELSY